MNQQQLIDAVAGQSGRTASDVRAVYHALRDVIAKELANGNTVSLTNLGTFRVVESTQTRRDPHNGQPLPEQGPFKVVKFRPSPTIVRLVRGTDVRETMVKRWRGRGK